MTAQLGDIYKLSGKTYTIVAMSEPVLFDPEEYGFHPEGICSDCWRGYVCEYKISRNILALDKLHINCGDGNYPKLNGVRKGFKGNYDMPVYRRLNMKMDYSGSIVLGRGFLSQYYIHMGFQRAWAYREIVELVFEHGTVVDRIDHSEFVAKLREQIDADPAFEMDLRRNPISFIEESFSLNAADKAWWIDE